jgi:hypothetical protein
MSDDITNALAYAIIAIEGLPEQSRERGLLERIESMLAARVPDHGERERLLNNMDRRINGRGGPLRQEIKQWVETILRSSSDSAAARGSSCCDGRPARESELSKSG